MTENKYQFLNDRPVKKDTIGHYKIIANQLFDTIHCNLDKPFVIGLFGSWGTGKSSIIEMLGARCEREKKEKTKVIVVDAWRKDKAIFNRQFLKKVARELFKENKQYEKIKKELDEKETISTSGWKPSKIAWFFFVVFILAFIACIVISLLGWYNNKETNNPFPLATIAGSIAGLLIASYFQLLLPKFSIGTNTTMDDISFHDIDHFRKIYFDKIIRKTKEECVCIVVDNLDRVEAEDALTIIRTLKTFIVDAKEDKGTKEAVDKQSLDKVVFIVPCCDNELEQHIKTSGAVEKETEFLHKFFNVSFRIPEFRQQDAFQYARKLIDEEMKLDFEEKHKSTICHIIKESYGSNPRKAKIFLNNFLMRYNTAKACEEARKIEPGIITEHPDWLAIYMVDEDLDAGSLRYLKNLRTEIDPECGAAIRFLKRPNDFDLIDGLDELLQMACRNEETFAGRLSKRAGESQEIIDAIWGNINHGDSMSQINVVASVICAIEENSEIIISPTITEQMAWCLASQHPQNLKDMSGKLVYERILKGKPEEVIRVIENMGHNVNGIICSQRQIQYSVDILKAVLEDFEVLLIRCQAHLRPKLGQEITKAIERLVRLGDEILPIAIKYPKFKSEVLFNKALERCNEGYLVVLPDDIVEYCMALVDTNKDNTHFITDVIQCFDKVLGYFKNEEVWDREANEEVETKSEECAGFLRALRSINSCAHEHDMQATDSKNTLRNLDELFGFADDRNKLEILKVFGVFEKYEKWSGQVDLAASLYNSRRQELL